MKRISALSINTAHCGNPDLALNLVAKLKLQDVSIPLEVNVVDDCSPVKFPQTKSVREIRRNVNLGFASEIELSA